MAQKVLRPLWKKENQNLKENKMSEISKEELPKINPREDDIDRSDLSKWVGSLKNEV